MTVKVQEAAGDRQPFLDFYLVQHLLGKKGKLIHPVNCGSLIYKQNGNSQQAALRHSGCLESYYDALYLDSQNHSPH